MLPCVPLVPQKLGVHLHTKDQLTKQYYGAKNKRNRFTRKKGKVPLSWRCGDASWVSWCHFGELCVTGCVLCDSLTWPSLQHENETVNDHTETTWSAFITRRGCWWWNERADQIAKSGCGRDDKWQGQTLILWWLYTNRWSQKNCPKTALLTGLCCCKTQMQGFQWASSTWPMQLLTDDTNASFHVWFCLCRNSYKFIYLCCCCFVLTNIYKHE
jgi:hypothetical protein